VGQFAEAVRLASDAVRIAESVGHPFSIVASLALCGATHVRKGEFGVSIPMLERGLQLARACDIRQWTGTVVACLALAYATSGRSADATQLLESAKSIATSRNSVVSWGPDLSQALLWSNRRGDAIELANRFLSVTSDSERAHHAWMQRVLGEIASSQDAPEAEKAAAYYHQAIERGRVLGLRPHVAHCHLGLGKLYRRTGQSEQAHENLATATTMYREMDMRFWLEQAEAELRELV
jgi:tetratricopeptide (TPR) repeat protein